MVSVSEYPHQFLRISRGLLRNGIGEHKEDTLGFIKRRIRGRPRREFEVFDTPKPSSFKTNQNLESKAWQLPRNEDPIQEEKKSCMQGTAKRNIAPEISVENQYLRLSKVVTPLYQVPYHKQLQLKQKNVQAGIGKLIKAIKSSYHQSKYNFSNYGCEVDEIIASPVIEQFRNKDEFGIRNGIDNNPKTVGFFVGNFQANNPVVSVNPVSVNIVKDQHAALALAFQDYIRDSSLKACHNFEDGGFWRGITVHSNRKDKLMATVIAHPQNHSQVEINEECSKICDHFEPLSRNLSLSSMYFQACPHTRCSAEQAPYHHLFGSKFLSESVNNIMFKVYPDVVYKSNTDGLEVLNNNVRKLCFLEERSVVVHVNCGTGLLDLQLSNSCSATYGIDSSSAMIKYAGQNAQLNGNTNSKFICKKLEIGLIEVLDSLSFEDVTVIINCTHTSAITKKLIRILRESKVGKILFVSTGLSGQTQDNVIELCKATNREWTIGLPFKLIFASPVDLMPQTRHTELILLFER